MLTLTGFGGAGKTRLAHRLAEEMLASYPNGVWWIELAHLTDPAHVPSAVAAAVGVPETQGMALTGQLAHRFGERSVLLVLDTCEHLRSGCADLATGLLRDCRNLAVLATSQEPLGVAGERDYPLAALRVPAGEDADASAEEPAQSEAVRLFVDRARLGVPDFAPDAHELTIIADIVRQLDGIPLAIELAAARVRFLSLAALRDHLSDRFRLLAGGDRAIARHETMRASIEWSHDHLAPDEQQLLRRLSVFAGGFGLAAVARVAQDDDDELGILDPVTRLVDKSLLQVERDRDGEPRYRMLATMRQFAQEKLAAGGDGDAVRRRHADYFVAAAECAAIALHGKGVAGALALLDRDFDNLMVAHEWCRASPDCGALALRLAHALELYWLDRGLLARGMQVMTEALRHPDAQAPSRARAQLLLGAARHALLCGDTVAARAWIGEGTDVARTLGAADLESRALALSGSAAQREGDAVGGRRDLDAALAVARRVPDPAVLRAALDDLGEFHRGNGALGEAAAALEESLALARAGDDVAALHLALRDAARLAVERRELERAAVLLREALEHACSSGARFDGENDLEVAGELAGAREDWVQAARFAGAADAAASAMGSARANRDDAITGTYAAAPRAALGEAAFAAAFADGQRLRLADALAEARDWVFPRPEATS